jgi:hypothetical protein
VLSRYTSWALFKSAHSDLSGTSMSSVPAPRGRARGSTLRRTTAATTTRQASHNHSHPYARGGMTRSTTATGPAASTRSRGRLSQQHQSQQSQPQQHQHQQQQIQPQPTELNITPYPQLPNNSQTTTQSSPTTPAGQDFSMSMSRTPTPTVHTMSRVSTQSASSFSSNSFRYASVYCLRKTLSGPSSISSQTPHNASPMTLRPDLPPLQMQPQWSGMTGLNDPAIAPMGSFQGSPSPIVPVSFQGSPNASIPASPMEFGGVHTPYIPPPSSAGSPHAPIFPQQQLPGTQPHHIAPPLPRRSSSSSTQPAMTVPPMMAPVALSPPDQSMTPGSDVRLGIRTDRHYDPVTRIWEAVLELPGVKKSDVHVTLELSTFNHMKEVKVRAEIKPVLPFVYFLPQAAPGYSSSSANSLPMSVRERKYGVYYRAFSFGPELRVSPSPSLSVDLYSFSFLFLSHGALAISFSFVDSFFSLSPLCCDIWLNVCSLSFDPQPEDVEAYVADGLVTLKVNCGEPLPPEDPVVIPVRDSTSA